MVGYIIGLIELGISGVAIVSMSQWHWRHGGRLSQWFAIGAFLIAGGWLGVWMGTRLEFQFGDSLKCLGLPLPLAVFALEGENWTDFVPSPAVQWLYAVANILTYTALSLGIYTTACVIFRHRLQKRVGAEVDSHSP